MLIIFWIFTQTWGAQPALDPTLSDKLQTTLPTTLEKAKIPGMTLGYFANGGADLLLAMGVKNSRTREPLETSTIFEAASLSKPVFAYLCMRLVDQNLLDLDLPLANILPDPRMSHSQAFGKITARMLLSHRSGLPNWGGERLDFKFEPDSDFQYSGEGYVYLGKVVEKITGRTLSELFQTEVFDPLGMVNSSFTWKDAYSKNQAIAHDAFGDPNSSRRKSDTVNTASSLYTTVEDYLRFTKQLSSGTGLKSETFKTMLLPRGAAKFGEPPSLPGNMDLQWCLGWGRLMVEGSPVYWHWGDNGDFKAWVMWRPLQKDGLAYFSNSSEGHALLEEITSLFHPEIAKAVSLLGYETYDAPGRAERRAALHHVNAGEYEKAIGIFDLALLKNPHLEPLKTMREWTQDLARVKKRPLKLTSSYCETIAGTYGPRTIIAGQGHLFYQRTGGKLFPLIPLGNHLFALDGEFSFRIQIEMDSQEQPTKITGIYFGGGKDETRRGPED